MQLSKASFHLQLMSVLDELKVARWFWCLLLVVFVAIRHLAGDDAVPTGPKFGDTDDALRLVQIREFLIHGSWYDTRLPSIGAPEALHSHWSRLIDLPVAWLISFFALFTGYLNAETAAQIVWPLLLLFVVARFLVHEAERRAGTQAGLIVLGLLLLCLSGLFQFMPGRIDHHNAQIACAVISLILLQRTITDPSAGWYAGGVMALGLIIGFEALPLLAATVGLACLAACFDHQSRPGVARAVVALAIGLIVGHVITTHPSEWASADCDKLGLNLLALVIPGAAAVSLLILRFRHASQWVWLVGFAVAGAVGIGLYLATNPVCASGAFAGMDPYVKKHWLDRVIESQSLLQLAETVPSGVFGYLVTMALSLTILIRQAATSRATDDIFWAASTVLAGLYGFYYVKFMPYGALLSILPLACWIARLPAYGETRAEAICLAAVIACSQTLSIMLASFVIGLFSNVEKDATAKTSLGVAHCISKSDIAALSKLPAGLVISDIDLGPFIVLSTRHRAYAGPYHRIHRSIGDVLRLQNASLADADPLLAKMKADYLVLCSEKPKAATAQKGAAQNKAARTSAAKPKLTFQQHLLTGGTFEGLEPVAIKTAGPLKVWKIVKPAS